MDETKLLVSVQSLDVNADDLPEIDHINSNRIMKKGGVAVADYKFPDNFNSIR